MDQYELLHNYYIPLFHTTMITIDYYYGILPSFLLWCFGPLGPGAKDLPPPGDLQGPWGISAELPGGTGYGQPWCRKSVNSLKMRQILTRSFKMWPMWPIFALVLTVHLHIFGRCFEDFVHDFLSREFGGSVPCRTAGFRCTAARAALRLCRFFKLMQTWVTWASNKTEHAQYLYYLAVLKLKILVGHILFAEQVGGSPEHRNTKQRH